MLRMKIFGRTSVELEISGTLHFLLTDTKSVVISFIFKNDFMSQLILWTFSNKKYIQ